MKRTNATTGEGEVREALTPTAVLLQVHLWAGASDPDVPPPALAMVADLLQVRGGELREMPAGMIAASFSNPVLAVNAARNVQRLVQGFSRAWQGGALGGCTILSRVEEAGDRVDVRSLRNHQALKQTHPGQVIFAGGLCDAVRVIPGLEFRSIAGVLEAAGKNGTPRQTLQLLPPLRMKGFVEEPFEPKGLDEARQRAAATEISARPVSQPAEPITPRVPAYVLPSSPPSGRTTAVVPVAPPSPASGSMRTVHAEPAATDAIGSFSREEKTSGGGLSRWAMIGGGVAAAAIAGVLIFTPIFRKPAQPAAGAARPSSESAAPEPAAATPNVVPARREASPPALASAKNRTNDAAHPSAAVPAATAPVVQEAAEPAPVEDVRAGRGLTFTPAEISSLIAHADKDSGNGDFDKAIQEYRLVLSREPSNDLAKRGLARALYNKEHQ